MKETRANVPALYAIWRGVPETRDLAFLRREGMTLLLEATLAIVREAKVCHVCGKKAVYEPGVDRQFHIDGTDNRECWRRFTG